MGHSKTTVITLIQIHSLLVSKQYPDIPNDKNTAKKYIKFLLSHSSILDVYVGGSRSPLTAKKPNRWSDWDLFITTNVDRVFISRPRDLKIFNADVHQGTKIPPNYVHYKEILK